MSDKRIPNIIYGTAWKEEQTQEFVFKALQAGFRAIDTANQRKHYHEAGVGEALAQAYQQLGLQRESIFLQSKFTYAGGQDHRLPYDESASFSEQVKQSLASSLEHLNTSYLDSYVLHGPSTGVGLTSADFETWTAMEELQQAGLVKQLGVSNVRVEQLMELYGFAKVKPLFVQNRCFAETGWDFSVREFCRQNSIHYQGFSLLTANWRFLGGEILRPEERNIPQLVFAQDGQQADQLAVSEDISNILNAHQKSIQQVILRFAQQIGMIPLVGTRSYSHMQMDLQLNDFSLTPTEIAAIERIAVLRQ